MDSHMNSYRKRDSHIYMDSYIFFHILFHYRLFQDTYIAPCALRSYCLFHVQWCVSVNPQFSTYLSPSPPFGNHKSAFYVCKSIYVL